MIYNSIIDEFWIINETGQSIYNESENEICDPDLFSGFISALNAFASEIGMDEINIIKGRNFKLTIIHDNHFNLSFVGRSKLNQSNEEIIRFIQKLKNNFILQFKENLLEWNGELNLFKVFKKEII